jgi:hypothetical protein
VLHRLAQLALAGVMLAAVCIGFLAWRLSQGPLELPWLVHRLEKAVNATGSPAQLAIGSAALAWEGFRHGVDMPLDLRLTEIVATDPAGTRVAQVPRAEVSLSLGWLLAGRVVPRAIEVDGARLHVWRTEDGTVTLVVGSAGNGDRTVEPEPPPAASAPSVPALLKELARPPSGDRTEWTSRWSELRRVRIHDAAITVSDQQVGLTWGAPSVEIDLRRAHDGGVQGHGDMDLVLGDPHAGGQEARLALAAVLRQDGQATSISASLTPIVPAALARLAPTFAPLAALEAPVTLSGRAALGPDLDLTHFSVGAEIGAGPVYFGRGSAPVLAASVQAEGSLNEVDVQLRRIETAPRPDGPRTVIQGRVQATRDAGHVKAAVTVDVDRVAFADLPALWPEGLGGPGTRPWITKNITAGIVQNAHFAVSLEAPEDFSDATVTSVSGQFDGQDLTVHWLRPVPPIEHAAGRLTLVTPDTMEVTVSSGRQAGGAIVIRGARVVLTGIAGHDQFADIQGDLAGPLPDLLTLLRNPKIRLLDRRPIEMRDPAGQFAGKLTVTRLPLRDDLSLDDLQIQTTAKLTQVHLGGIAAGRDLDNGTLDLQAGNEGLKVSGTATLSGIPAQLRADMDFRSGPPTQVLQTITVSGTPSVPQLAAAGFDIGDFVTGSPEISATFTERRNGKGDLSVETELTQVTLTVPRLGWSKPPGRPAAGELRLLLDRGRITGTSAMRVTGSGIDVRADTQFANGQLAAVRLSRVVLGQDTDVSGEVKLPQRAGEPYVVKVTGTSIDASSEFTHQTTAPGRPRSDKAGPPWVIDARFDRVLVGPGRALNSVAVSAENGGRLMRRVSLSGQAGQGTFRISIEPNAGGRSLSASASDGGELLRALDIAESMYGGRMTLTGQFDDRQPGEPLSGTAEIADFRVRNAPALALLLQAMTLYGLVDVVRGPGLAFSQLTAPFQLSGDTLELREARAFSSSLGMTAKGRVDLARNTADMEGTIVPAYFFNSLLGHIPLLGKLFSPEKGGGVFAATYTLRGPLDNPKVSVNPLAALTPGFLRGIFGLFDGSKPPVGEQSR